MCSAHPEVVSDAGHESCFSDEVKLQPDLAGQLIYGRGQVKSELRPLQELRGAPDLDKILAHGRQSPRVLDLDGHQPIWSQACELLLRLSPVDLRTDSCDFCGS